MGEEAGVPIILVGDSLGMVVLGYDSTIPVTMEEILHHVKAVVRGTRRAHVVADMPFMSYQASPQDALRNAGRMLKEGGAQSVKLEGGQRTAEGVRLLVAPGPHCDGQVQVFHDMLGLFADFVPKHAKRYARIGEVVVEAVSRYVDEVQEGGFPTDKG